LVVKVPGVTEARCLLLSQIGMPVGTPVLAEVCLRTKAGYQLKRLRRDVEHVLKERLADLADFWRKHG
jgi:S-adenosylmethionine synthetase